MRSDKCIVPGCGKRMTPGNATRAEHRNLVKLSGLDAPNRQSRQARRCENFAQIRSSPTRRRAPRTEPRMAAGGQLGWRMKLAPRCGGGVRACNRESRSSTNLRRPARSSAPPCRRSGCPRATCRSRTCCGAAGKGTAWRVVGCGVQLTTTTRPCPLYNNMRERQGPGRRTRAAPVGGTAAGRRRTGSRCVLAS